MDDRSSVAHWMALYTFIGLSSHSEGDASLERAVAIQNALAARFTFHWSLLIPPLLILSFIIRKKLIIPGMLPTSAVATVLACIIQGTVFKTAVGVMVYGTSPPRAMCRSTSCSHAEAWRRWSKFRLSCFAPSVSVV